MENIALKRFELQSKIFAKFGHNIPSLFHSRGILNIPRLWSAPINHYRLNDRNEIIIDYDKQSKHIKNISQYIGGHLINGSTGDGWIFNDMFTKVEIAKNILNSLDTMGNEHLKKPLMFGCLEESIDNKMTLIDRYIEMLLNHYNCNDSNEFLDRYVFSKDDGSPFIGFCINPESNNKDMKSVKQGIVSILKKYEKFPCILYQIPQITNSEIDPESFKDICDNVCKIYLFGLLSDNIDIYYSIQI